MLGVAVPAAGGKDCSSDSVERVAVVADYQRQRMRSVVEL